MTSQNLNRRQARQALYLLQFNFILKHVPERSMGKADGLSRRPDWQQGVEKDNKDQTLIKLGQIREAETLVEKGDPRKRIQKAQKGDEKIVKVVEELKGAGIKLLKDKKQEIEDEVVMKEGQMSYSRNMIII